MHVSAQPIEETVTCASPFPSLLPPFLPTLLVISQVNVALAVLLDEFAKASLDVALPELDGNEMDVSNGQDRHPLQALISELQEHVANESAFIEAIFRTIRIHGVTATPPSSGSV